MHMNIETKSLMKINCVEVNGPNHHATMSKYDSSLNASPSYQSRECIIGQYIESLAHEVVSNQDIRFERAKQDIMVSASSNLVNLHLSK